MASTHTQSAQHLPTPVVLHILQVVRRIIGIYIYIYIYYYYFFVLFCFWLKVSSLDRCLCFYVGKVLPILALQGSKPIIVGTDVVPST